MIVWIPILPSEDRAGLLIIRENKLTAFDCMGAQTIHIRLQRFDPGGSSSGFVQQVLLGVRSPKIPQDRNVAVEYDMFSVQSKAVNLFSRIISNKNQNHSVK